MKKNPKYMSPKARQEYYREQQTAYYDEFEKGGAAKFDAGEKLTSKDYQSGEALTSNDYQKGTDVAYETMSPADLAKLQQSEMGNIKTDPRHAQAEMDALRGLEERAKGGFSAQDRLDMAKMQSNINRRAKGRQGAIKQQMQSRGMTGSGNDLMMQMQNSQDAVENEALASMEKAAQMQNNSRQATIDAGNMASNQRNQQFGEDSAKAQARDAVNRFNTQNSVARQNQNVDTRNRATDQNWNRGNQTSDRNIGQQNDNTQQNWNRSNQTSDRNVGQQNDIAQQNWNRTNSTADRNVQANYQFRGDKLNNGVTSTNNQSAWAALDENKRRAEEEERKKRRRGQTGAILGAAGAVAGGIYGGPAGASAGAGLGNTLGSSFAAFGGFKDGEYKDAFLTGGTYQDSFLNDTEPTVLTPGELVVPASISRNPEAVKQFAIETKAAGPAGTISARNGNAYSPEMLDSLAKQSPESASLVERYRTKMSAADDSVASAQKAQKIGGYVDVAGGLLTDFNNSQKRNIPLEQGIGDKNTVPRFIDAKQDTWRSVAPLFDKGVSDAKEARAGVFAGIQKDEAVKGLGRQAEAMDPTSDVSKRAQMLAKSVLSSKAAEAMQVGTPEAIATAKQLREMDVSNMSAHDAKDFYDGLKNSDYKDVLNNQSADKRLGMQLKNDEKKIDNSSRDITFKLSERYSQDQTTKDTAQIRASAGRAEELAKSGSAINDMGLVYSLMKSFDPGSTVREGEFAMAAKSGSFSDQIRAAVQLAESGQMTPDKRIEIMNTIRRQAAAQETRQAQVDDYYSDLANQYGANSNLIVGKKGSTAQGQKNAPAPAPETKKVGGKTFIKVNGGWQEQ